MRDYRTSLYSPEFQWVYCSHRQPKNLIAANDFFVVLYSVVITLNPRDWRLGGDIGWQVE
jgi:hypothetical protein